MVCKNIKVDIYPNVNVSVIKGIEDVAFPLSRQLVRINERVKVRR